MNKGKAFILLIVLSFFYSCKKKNQSCDKFVQNFSNDTIYPSDYLMTYPGCWWEYQNGFTDSCTNWESVEFRTITDDKGCITACSERYVLPRSTAYGLLMKDKNIVSNTTNESTVLHPIIGGENVGDHFFNFTTSWPPSAPMPGETRENYYLENHLTSYTVQGQIFQDVIVIRIEQKGLVGGTQVFSYNKYRYYAKDVGLIKSYILDYTNTVYDLKELVNFFIAPH